VIFTHAYSYYNFSAVQSKQKREHPKMDAATIIAELEPHGTGSTVPLQPYVEIKSHSTSLPVSRMGGNGPTQHQPGGSSVELRRSVGPNGARKDRGHDFWTHPMIHLVLDTNIYTADRRRDSGPLRARMRLCKGGMVKLHVPYVVTNEFLS
jgi:hypothetical protein